MKPLTEVSAGKRFRIAHLSSQPETCSRLREMGFCENVVIRCVNIASGNIICDVCNTRVALNHVVASSIYVSPFDAHE